jgi:protein-S-isoprenylcysteine O-methyltransferase Ste14
MKALWLLLKNLLYLVFVPGLVAGWLPLGVFERRAQWPGAFAGLHFTGAAITLLGVAIFLHGTWVFAVRGHGTPSFFDPPKKLTRRGPYKWVRNPLYLAFFAIVAGEGLFFRSWHIGIYFILLVCALHLLVMGYEEGNLRFRFGAIYEDYKRDVPRWLPRKPKPVLHTVAPFEARR